jgi:dTDP-4-dehydrorhamnose 3,5-epimerase
MDATDLDNSLARAQKDHATVTPDGTRVETRIDGVIVSSPINHVDHRGRVFEIFAGETDAWVEPLVYCYAFTVRPNQVKGWGLHLHKDDRYTLIAGEMLTLLYDARTDSPTHGVVQKVTLSGQGARKLLIPRGVWHLNIALGDTEVLLINHPTAVYNHGAPDRYMLPLDTSEIPIDASVYWPRQAAHPSLT